MMTLAGLAAQARLLRLTLAAAVVFPGADLRAMEHCFVDPGVITELFDWIGANTDYDVEAARAAPPEIYTCEKGEMIDYEDADLVVEGEIRGLYDLERRRVILTEPWDVNDLEDRSTLLHELIHHVQWTSREWPCPGAPEWEAYKLQERWLTAQGVVAEFDWVAILLRSQCERDIHRSAARPPNDPLSGPPEAWPRSGSGRLGQAGLSHGLFGLLSLGRVRPRFQRPGDQAEGDER